VDLPPTYPEKTPILRLRNLSPDILNNNKMQEFEDKLHKKAEENIGNMMIYELCDMLKEEMSGMNELILRKL
jgi:hypothetical protein